MPYIISEVSVEGFRGINKSLKLKTNGGTCLLFGTNGAGKTSILQAIEWCLTGKLPYLEGREFRLEDAIVNMFHPGKTAIVSVLLKDEKDKTITITRRRKMTKSTTSGKSSLQVQIGSKTANDDEAEQVLERTLGISSDDFDKIVYLHQEAIRDIITADPKDMSQTIDRLLGTFELRELGEALDAGRIINSEQKKLKARVETLERDKISFVVGMRKRLNRDKETLLEKGLRENQLTLENVTYTISALLAELKKIAAQVGISSPDVKSPEPNSESIGHTLDEIENQLKKLDRFRVTALSKQETLRINLENMKNQHEDAEKALQEFKDVTPESILTRRREIDSQLKELQPRIDGLQERVNNLTELKIRLNAAIKQIGPLQDKIEEVEKKYGDEKQHVKTIEEYKIEIKKIEKEMATFSTHAQLVSLALELLEKSKPEKCPVCTQRIDYVSVASDLKKETQTFISKNLAQLKTKKEELNTSLTEIGDDLENYREMKEKLLSEKENLNAVNQEIESVLDRKMQPSFNIDDVIKDSKKDVFELSSKATALSKESLALEQKLKTLENTIGKFEESQKKIQDALSSSDIGKKLIKNLEGEIDQIKKKAETYKDTETLDAVGAKIGKTKELVAYLKSKDELDELEKQLPEVTKLVSDLKGRMEQLSVLEGSLEAIRQVTIAHQKNVAITMIGTLEDLMNKHYNEIMGHPFFAKLHLEPEEEHPFIYSIKASNSDLTQSTYIPTRFSNTQMNVVALSIFLSNNLRMSGNLALLIMDDPAQSMDEEHRRALARTVKTLAKDRQIIIATQDHEMKKAMDAEVQKYQIYEFASWKPEGILIEQ